MNGGLHFPVAFSHLVVVVTRMSPLTRLYFSDALLAQLMIMAAENDDDDDSSGGVRWFHSLHMSSLAQVGREGGRVFRNPAERENPFSTDYPPPPLPRPFAAAVKLIEFVSLHGNNFRIPEREMLKALFSLSLSPSLFLTLRRRGQLWLFVP